ncbi:MAG TPA: hypothetical protein VKU38_23400, partial [Ktedonobacteraceae bacterium]|nr:hypothetical protein [Ktedonobacteraceae bacterium]
GWLILAPFALGYQLYGADWVSQTTNDFVVGICVAVVALISFALFFFSLLGSLRAAGVIAARNQSQAMSVPAGTPPSAAAAPSPAANQSDLDRTLATLAAALAADLNTRRQASSDQQTNPLTEQNMTNRRDS